MLLENSLIPYIHCIDINILASLFTKSHTRNNIMSTLPLPRFKTWYFVIGIF